MNDNKKSAREAAYLSLMRCFRDKCYSNLETDSAIKKYSLSGADKGLYTTLVYGVLEKRITLDYIISRLSQRPLERLDGEVLTILRLGLYQLIMLDRIPESAAVNESVALAKRVKPSSASFVNALLRGFLRKYSRDELPLPDESDRISYLSIRYSCGEDVIRTLMASKDPEPTLRAFESERSVTLRVNTLKMTREELSDKLGKLGISSKATQLSPYGIRIGSTLPDELRALIESGELFVQDEASQLVSLILAPKSGERVYDICACPGGKSFSLAMEMNNAGELYSFDLHKNKLSLIETGADRLGISIIKTAEKNGSSYDETLDSTADRILCDVPCSGLGVIGKKPEIRYKTETEISGLPRVQYAILENSSRYLKIGGRLCYSTCTLNKAENEDIIDRFLAEHSNYRAVSFSVGQLKAQNGKITLRPETNGTDGFFISLLERRS